jgi:hypothetical protein
MDIIGVAIVTFPIFYFLYKGIVYLAEYIDNFMEGK